MHVIKLIPGDLSIQVLRSIWSRHVPIKFDKNVWNDVEKAEQTVQNIVKSEQVVYGVNTGFGKLALNTIPKENLKKLQKNLILSHATGVGEYLEAKIARLIMVMKLASLAQGYSGVRKALIQKLIDIYNAHIIPCIPAKGSVGASGDLAPLSHMSLLLLGEGDVIVNGHVIDAKTALQQAGIEPIELEAKEGLALINGTQVSTSLALHSFFMLETTFFAASLTGALTTDVSRGSDTPFDSRIHQIRRQKGQIKMASLYKELIAGSEIRDSHLENDERVQDPYCLRCQPQVMGACLDLIHQVQATLATEANAVTDNPLVFSDSQAILSGGIFHAEPIAFACDILALAISEIGSLSERRIAMLIDTNISKLPPFLVRNAGINSGFMIAHVSAAALASENKSLAHPASVDTIPTSANQEDHVSMATFAARRLKDMTENTMTIIAIELLAAAQGVDLLRPLRSSNALEKLHNELRKKVDFYEDDRYFAPDINQAVQLIKDGVIDELFKDRIKLLFDSYE